MSVNQVSSDSMGDVRGPSGYDVNGEYGRFNAVDYPDRDACPLGCGRTRVVCENMAERCNWVDPDADVAPELSDSSSNERVEIVDSITDIGDCPRCNNVCQWTYQHLSDGTVNSFDMCICGA